MNSSSLICNFIFENEDWEKRIQDEYGIKVSKDADERLAIFNYGIGCDFSIPMVQEARGIIIDLHSIDVICWPFRKFGNWNESYADKIDWNYAVARQKIDGSLVKLFCNYLTGEWQWSTNGTINARDAVINEYGETFWDIIVSADNYDDIGFDELDRSNTYLFELVSPQTQVVIRYPRSHLYHIGTRNNDTGKESNVDIGIEQPREFKVSDLDSIVEHANAINPDDSVTEEGYVVVDRDFNRIKVKSPKYLMMHSMLDNRIHTKKRIVNDIFLGKEPLISDLTMTAYYKFYEYQIADLRAKVNIFIEYCRAMYDEVSGDRYAVYEAVKNHPLAQFGLKAIESDLGAEALIDHFYNTRRESFLRLMPDYEINYDEVVKNGL